MALVLAARSAVDSACYWAGDSEPMTADYLVFQLALTDCNSAATMASQTVARTANAMAARTADCSVFRTAADWDIWTAGWRAAVLDSEKVVLWVCRLELCWAVSRADVMAVQMAVRTAVLTADSKGRNSIVCCLHLKSAIQRTFRCM